MGDGDTEDVLDTEQHEETETDEGALQDGATGEEEGSEGGEGAEGNDGEDEDVVQIGDEEAPASEEATTAPAWAKELRHRQKELARENRELKAQLQAGRTAQQERPQLPAKPKIADFAYDEEEFEKARDAWDAKKREIDKQVEAQEAEQRAAQQAQQQAVQAVQERYAKSKAGLKVKNFQDAEDAVMTSMTEWQRGIAVKVKDPALMVFALGSNPKKLSELASIKDPVEFAFAVRDLEKDIKVTKRPSGNKPAPETTVRGGSAGTNSKATLERLQAEADKSGDRSKVAAYIRQQRQTGKK